VKKKKAVFKKPAATKAVSKKKPVLRKPFVSAKAIAATVKKVAPTRKIKKQVRSLKSAVAQETELGKKTRKNIRKAFAREKKQVKKTAQKTDSKIKRVSKKTALLDDELEKLKADMAKLSQKKKPKKQLNEYNLFMRRQLREGKTFNQAVRLWKQVKKIENGSGSRRVKAKPVLKKTKTKPVAKKVKAKLSVKKGKAKSIGKKTKIKPLKKKIKPASKPRVMTQTIAGKVKVKPKIVTRTEQVPVRDEQLGADLDRLELELNRLKEASQSELDQLKETAQSERNEKEVALKRLVDMHQKSRETIESQAKAQLQKKEEELKRSQEAYQRARMAYEEQAKTELEQKEIELKRLTEASQQSRLSFEEQLRLQRLKAEEDLHKQRMKFEEELMRLRHARGMENLRDAEKRAEKELAPKAKEAPQEELRDEDFPSLSEFDFAFPPEPVVEVKPAETIMVPGKTVVVSEHSLSPQELAYRMLKLFFEEVTHTGFKRSLSLDDLINAYNYSLARVLERHPNGSVPGLSNEEVAYRISHLYFSELARMSVKRRADLDELLESYFYVLNKIGGPTQKAKESKETNGVPVKTATSGSK